MLSAVRDLAHSSCLSDPATAAISARSGEFQSAQYEAAFNDRQLEKTRPQLRATLLFCSCFFVAFSLTDFSVLGYGRDAFILLLTRLAVALTAAAGCVLSSRNPESVALTRLAASAAEIVALVAFQVVVAYRPNEIAWHAMSMALMLIVVYLYIPNRLAYSVAIALAATGGFIAMVLALGRLNASELLTMSMLLVLANAFGCVAARRYQVLWREEFRVQTVLHQMSMHDALTGCFNRNYLQHGLLEAELARAQRFKLHLTVIMCDLDHFKQVNEKHGHIGGDLVLAHFGRLLTSMTRTRVDSVVRYGGEEFLLVLPETALEGGVMLAERLRRALSESAVLPDARVTASIGVASANFAVDAPRSLREMISSADQLLYEAKNGGRNQVRAQHV